RLKEMKFKEEEEFSVRVSQKGGDFLNLELKSRGRAGLSPCHAGRDRQEN
ncbi:hypothetical protein A2U01_0083213, partial [Trifolium medium]|nr:hypothetical protein [Trifolium medium]